MADDLFEKAGGLFKKLGSTLKQTSKQVTGIGRGSVRLELDRTRVAPGETLRGRVVLDLPEAVEAKRLVVTLAAHQRTVSVERIGAKRTPVSARTEVFHFDLELAGARLFERGTTSFELVVPPDALDKQAPVGSHPIADAVRSVASVLSPTAGPIEWSVTARLDVPWGRDLSATVDIAIAR
ncbi:MAG TPA: hypothetical protein VGG74_19465 [Kofleriaceae bacterium]